MNTDRVTYKNTNPQTKAEKYIKDIQKKSYIKECFCENKDCNLEIIKSHSIQNNKILSKISSEGNVLSFSNPTFMADSNRFSFLHDQLTGRKKATTFTGFCQYHDNEIFKPVELYDYEPNNIEQEFLFAYRALAKEYHAKRRQHKSLIVAMEKEGLKKCPTPLREYERGIKVTIKQLEKDRRFFNQLLLNKKFENIKTRIVIFDNEYHLAVSSCFAPERDLHGKLINEFSHLTVDLNYIYLTIFPQNGKTFVLFSYLRKNQRKLSAFIDQIDDDNLSMTEKQKIISNMLAIYCENIVLSPERWSKVPDSQQQIFYDVIDSTINTNHIYNLQKLQNINLFI
ncbi:hypothetical protein V0288_10380 [Pannus brasiliensis CCIBt3594]|uniref:Uncharacterized protein n=1 Tax=Pannus brasiliensis CCIBt3594 TaxID=1427578 RepID=A0AAW9QKP8_9CHRO